MLDLVDTTAIQFLNGFAQQNHAFDVALVMQARYALLKGVVLATLLWFAWGLTRDDGSDRVPFASRSILGALLAIVVGRAMQNLLPARVRPLHEPSLGFVLPHGVDPAIHTDMSSFPSDHALLFFAVATAVWARSRALGALAFAWTAVMICLPRIYLGYHYPTDILAGAVIGIGLMQLVLHVRLPGRQGLHRLIPPGRPVPGWAIAFAFLFTYQLATLFHEVRKVGAGLEQLVRGMIGD